MVHSTIILPKILLIKIGLAESIHTIFLRLLDMSYMALVVTYAFGLGETIQGGLPLEVVLELLAMVVLVSSFFSMDILALRKLGASWKSW